MTTLYTSQEEVSDEELTFEELTDESDSQPVDLWLLSQRILNGG